ncbi:MAG TPA: double zinc ribbon domain-containing protein, partial [Casimicrobiaceae bacterium]|nr:double zinc ribbon domain-containing protein [Casimicrobiaceae bacterium]
IARIASAGLALLRRSLPQACALCRADSGDTLLCDACSLQLPRIIAACPRCALPSAGALVCGACLARPPPYAAAIAAWAYAFPADRLLHAFKYRGELALAEPLAQALCAAVATRDQAHDAALPDCIVPVPLSPRRQRMRGFNHAREIARRVGSAFGVPLAGSLRRTRDTPAQAALRLADRAANVRGAFDADANFAGLSVAIVDDVMTTGATLAAAAGALLDAGALRVEAWAVARTLPPHAAVAPPPR